jgi:glycosyltransferase involved in cell wall biosynthesis
MQKLSVILITLNEEKNIDRCLQSVRWADEIIVVDSYSVDRTVALARQYTENVYQNEYAGSTRQMEWGIQHASGDWILFVDADEVVSHELASEIQIILHNPPPVAGYQILRRPYAFGKWIEHGGWYPDHQFRFFRKDSYTVNHEEVHGGFGTKGPTGRLQGHVLHYTYPTIYSYVSRMNDYTSLQVSNKLSANPGTTAKWYNLLLSPLSHFLRKFLSNKGYKDGFHGFVLALLDATYTLLLYAKLWEYQMQRKEGRGTLPPITNVELNRLKHHR